MIEIQRVHNRKIYFHPFFKLLSCQAEYFPPPQSCSSDKSPTQWSSFLDPYHEEDDLIDFNLRNWDIKLGSMPKTCGKEWICRINSPPESDPALISRTLNCRLFPGASECQDRVGSCHHGCQMVQCQNCGNSRTGDFMLRFLHIESTFYKFAHWIEDRSFIFNRKDRQQNCLLSWMYPWLLWITLRQCWGGQVQTSNISILKDGPLTPKPTTLVFCWVCVA